MSELWMHSVGVRVDISVVPGVQLVPGVLGGSTHLESPAHRSHRSGRSGAAQRAAKRVFVSSSQTILGSYGTSRAENNLACRPNKWTDDLTGGAAGQELAGAGQDRWPGWLLAGQGRWPGWHADGVAG